MKLLTFVFGNPGLKLLALVMAWGVWYIAHEDLTENATRTAEVLVLVEGGDELEAAVRVPKLAEVAVTVSGPQRAVSGYQALQSSRVIARVTPDMLAGDKNEELVIFDMRSLEFPDIDTFPDLRVAAVSPSKVKVKIRRMVVETKTVDAPEGLQQERHGVVFQVDGWDARVDVRGASADLLNLVSIRTYADEQELEQYALNMGPDELRRTVTLRLLIDEDQAEVFELVGRTHLTATVQLVQVDDRNLELPIHILAAIDETAPAAGRLRFSGVNELRYEYYVKADPDKAEPPKVRLSLRGVPRALESLDPATLLAFVYAAELKLAPGETRGSLKVHLDGLPPGVTLLKEYELAVELAR